MDPLRPIVDWITRPEVGHPTRAGLDGPSAAGKTTLADALVAYRPVHHEPSGPAHFDRRFPSPGPQIPLYPRGVDAAMVPCPSLVRRWELSTALCSWTDHSRC